MGAAHQGIAAKRLLRKCAAGRHGHRFSRQMRGLFRHHWRTGLCVAGRWRYLEPHRPRSPGRAFRRSPDTQMIRVILPAHLRTLGRLEGEVKIEIEKCTVEGLLDALEVRYPMLRGAIRDHVTQKRRPYVRFFACETDLSH